MRLVETQSVRPITIWLLFSQRDFIHFNKESLQRIRVLLCLVIGAVMAFGMPATMTSAEAGAQRIEIKAKRFAFEPAEITLKRGQPVVIVLKSEDVAHGLRIRDLDFAVKVSPGGTAEAPFTPQRTGDFVGHCFVFCGSGHGSMALKVHVVD